MAQEIERRWLLAPSTVVWPEDVVVEEREIIQTELTHPEAGVMERVRMALMTRVVAGAPSVTVTHTHTVKRSTGVLGQREEHEREVSSEEYSELRKRAHPDKHVIKKTRGVFEWDGRRWEFDRVIEPVPLWILELEVEKAEMLTEKVVLPPWLPVIYEVTSTPGWHNSDFSRKDWTPPDRCIPGPWLDRLVWEDLHYRQEVPEEVPPYSTDTLEAMKLIEMHYRQGELVEFHRILGGQWVLHTSRFFYEDDPDKRSYDDTAFRLSAWGGSIAHAISVLVVANGVSLLEEEEWYQKWAWEWGNGDTPPILKSIDW